MLKIAFNGKFTAQRMTGVQRVASELLRAVDGLMPGDARLLHPPTGVAPRLSRIEARALGPVGLPLHAWEQALLPTAARGRLLVNLAGAAPALARRQLCLVHDAAVFDAPGSYTRAFVLWYRRLFRHLARRAQLVTVSNFSRQRLALHLHLQPETIALMPNGCDHLARTEADRSTLPRLGLAPGGYLLAVGSANPSKNLPRLVRAHARSGLGTACPLVIAGGRDPAVFANEPSLDEPGVARIGPVEDPALKALYEGALALVYPSLYEGFGLPPLEAMHSGCPVIAARAASLPEVCGDAAFYIDPMSEAEMAAAMCRVAADADLRAHLSQAGRRRAVAFSWSRSAAVLSCLALEAART